MYGVSSGAVVWAASLLLWADKTYLGFAEKVIHKIMLSTANNLRLNS